MKTKGALIWEFNKPWSVEEIDIGDPRKGEVKVALEPAGMCHSDHHVVTGDIPVAAFPVLGGHEGAGVVIEVGEGVDDLEPGDHVAASFIPSTRTRCWGRIRRISSYTGRRWSRSTRPSPSRRRPWSAAA